MIGRIRRRAAALAAIGLASCLAPAAVGQSLWELTPYDVRLVLALAPDPEFTPRLVTELRESLLAGTRAAAGPIWNATVVAAPLELSLRATSNLAGVTRDDLPEALRAADKALVVAVSRGPQGYRVESREHDLRTQQWGSLSAEHVALRRDVPAAAIRAALAAFCPLARIESVAGDEAALRVRGSGLPAGNDDFQLLRPAELFRPVLWVAGRGEREESARPIEHTFLVARDSTTGPLRAAVISGFPRPLASRRRGRSEQLAVAVRPGSAETRLQLVSRGATGEPLVGYEVFAHPPGDRATVRVGVTDRRGQLAIPPADHPLRVLLIRSGQETLARLPLAPGVDSLVTARLANDDPRLVIESWISGVQESIVDVVVRRELLLARWRQRQEAGEDSAGVLAELKALKTRQHFRDEIAVAARGTTPLDPQQRQKIDRLLQDTLRLLEKVLDPAELERLEQPAESAESAETAETES